jgi:hypothetical protein
MRAFCIVGSSVWCEDQPCNWVRREGRDREEKRKYLLAKSADKNCKLHLNTL